MKNAHHAHTGAMLVGLLLASLSSACGADRTHKSTSALPVTHRESQVVVNKRGTNVPMRSVYAVLQEHGNLGIVFSSDKRTCTDGAYFDDRPGEVTFVYDIGQHILHDGSTTWSRRGYQHANHGVTNLGEDMLDAIVENRPGGRVRFRFEGDDAQPFELSDTMSVQGSVDTTVCPSPAPADPAVGTGSIEIGDRTFPIGIALFDASPDNPDYQQRMTLDVAILDWKPSSACKSQNSPGLEASLRFTMTKQGELLSVTLEGDRYREVTGSSASFTIQPQVVDLKDGDSVEIRGATELFEHAYMNNETGAFKSGEGYRYHLKISGKVRVLDCRKPNAR